MDIWEVPYITVQKEVEIREQDVDRGKGDEGERRGRAERRGGGRRWIKWLQLYGDLNVTVYCTFIDPQLSFLRRTCDFVEYIG